MSDSFICWLTSFVSLLLVSILATLMFDGLFFFFHTLSFPCHSLLFSPGLSLCSSDPTSYVTSEKFVLTIHLNSVTTLLAYTRLYSNYITMEVRLFKEIFHQVRNSIWTSIILSLGTSIV